MKNYKNYIIDKNKGRPALLSRLVTAHLKGKEADLNQEDEIILKRWKMVESLSTQHRPCISNADIVRSLMSTFGISEVTAFKDITNSQRLFGNIHKTEKKFKVAVYVEWLEQLASLSEAKGDMKSAISAIKEAGELMRLEKEDEDVGSCLSRTFNLNLFFGCGDSVKRKTLDLEKIDELSTTEFRELLRAVDRTRVDGDDMKLMLEKHHGVAEE